MIIFMHPYMFSVAVQSYSVLAVGDEAVFAKSDCLESPIFLFIIWIEWELASV